VVAEDGSPAFYDAGDTGLFSDMALIPELYSPTIALLPIGGIYTMKSTEAAIAVRNLQVRTVVPMHYGNARVRFFEFDPLEPFLKLFKNIVELPDATFHLRAADLPAETTVYVPAVPA
jgi:L-ascorbate metabolism protein UlaG (beta-lactamase superfamily)